MLPARVPPDVAPILPELIAAYEAALRPSGDREVAVILGRLAGHFYSPDRPAEHHALLVEDWLDDLAEYPTGVIAEAAREWRRSEKWL